MLERGRGSFRGLALSAALLVVGGLLALCCCRDSHDAVTAQFGDAAAGIEEIDGTDRAVTLSVDTPVGLPISDERQAGTSQSPVDAGSVPQQCALESARAAVTAPASPRAVEDGSPAVTLDGAMVPIATVVGPVLPRSSAVELPGSPAHLLCVMRT